MLEKHDSTQLDSEYHISEQQTSCVTSLDGEESNAITFGSANNHFIRHLLSPIDITPLAELELCLLTFCTGIQDATTFPDYHCFASNQTGNTVLLAVSVCVPQLAGNLFYTANVGVSLGLFLAGGVVTGQVSHHLVNCRGRLWLVFCNFFQTILVFGAAAFQFRYGLEKDGPHALATLCLLAFASGSQVVQSRSLNMTEISTAMATAAWVDLMIDRDLTKRTNRCRDRRLFFLLALIAGSFVGAITYRTAGSAWAITISAIGKLLVTAMFLFNKPTKLVEDHGGNVMC